MLTLMYTSPMSSMSGYEGGVLWLPGCFGWDFDPEDDDGDEPDEELEEDDSFLGVEPSLLPLLLPSVRCQGSP